MIKNGGGYRIAKIASYSSLSEKPIVKIYKYGKDENGNGFVKIDITPDAFMREHENSYTLIDYSVHEVKTRFRSYGSSTIINPLFSNGAPVLYSHVTEYIGDGDNNSRKTIYYYDVNESVRLTRIPKSSIYYPNIYSDWQAGCYRFNKIL